MPSDRARSGSLRAGAVVFERRRGARVDIGALFADFFLFFGAREALFQALHVAESHEVGLPVAVEDGETLGQQVAVDDLDFAVLGDLDAVADGGHALAHLHVLLLLEAQAASQAPAGAGEFGGGELDVLGLGVLDRDGREVLEPGGAAQVAPADADTTQAPRFVAHADLPELDAGVELGGQVLDEFSEVDPFLGG